MEAVEKEASRLEEGLEVTIPALGFAELVWSDYRAHHADLGESPGRAALRYLPR